jgi:hypothetical protein
MRAVLLSSLLLSGGCATTAEGPRDIVRLGQEIQIPLGGRVRFDEGARSLLFKSVVEDSRCPIGATCVWEGNAKIVVHVLVDAAGLDIELDSNARFATRGSAHGYTVELRRLEPAPRADTPTRGYTATLVVTKPQANP